MKRNGVLMKVIGVILILALCLSGCSRSDEKKGSGSDLNADAQSNSEVPEKKTDMAESGNDKSGTSGSSAASSDASNSANAVHAEYAGYDLAELDALTPCKIMGNGINLGNTMEAFGRSTYGIFGDVSSYETCWGQPVTTAEMIRGMKECGFDTLRIPVAWTNMMNFEAGDYTINPAYLDRVEEIVNYALDAGMFVIVNDHWDGGWWGMFGSFDKTSADNAFEMYKSMWRQIAERFRDYSEMLIFESANEELGDSLNNNSNWADSGALDADGCYRLTNEINQTFVDLIRSTGGNNDHRFLLIAGYNTDFDKTLDSRFMMPSDSAQNKLLLSVHYYGPWNYCGSDKDARWGTKAEYEVMDEQFAKMTAFTEKGYGVIIGEYGALPYWENNVPVEKQNTLAYTEHLLDNCDLYNFVPLLWSCNDFYRKSTQSMISDELAELFISRSYKKEMVVDGYKVMVRDRMAAAAEAAPDMWDDVETYEAGTPVAWIMWNGGAGTYSVGDVFNPGDNTAGITATNAIVEGAGEYSVSLDFAGGNTGLTFAALAIADCELIYPGATILIEEITYDGEPVTLTATPYTSSDDGRCTRVNLYNGWVNKLPNDARTMGSLSNASPCIVDPVGIQDIKNITIKFRLIVKG